MIAVSQSRDKLERLRGSNETRIDNCTCPEKLQLITCRTLGYRAEFPEPPIVAQGFCIVACNVCGDRYLNEAVHRRILFALASL